jgi:ribosomal-protein-alanine N-acetyltransferase
MLQFHRRIIMRAYSEKNVLVKVVCNRCGRELSVENGILKEECIHIEHQFGFFGKRDGENDRFDLCEECYREITQDFQHPVEQWERKELL